MKKILILIIVLFTLPVFAKIADNIPLKYHSIQNIETDKILASNIINKVNIDWTDHKYLLETKEIKEINENELTNQLNDIFIDMIINTSIGSNKNVYDYIQNSLSNNNSKEILKYLNNFIREKEKLTNGNVKYYLSMDMKRNEIRNIKNNYLYDDYKTIDKYLCEANKITTFQKSNDVKILGTNSEFKSIKALKNDLPYKPCEYDKNKQITGLIIKVDTGLNLTNSLCPKIRLSNGNVIYSPSMWLRDSINKELILKEISDFTYVKDIENEKLKNIKGQDGNPLIVNAINIAGINGIYTDIVISDKDAYLVQQYYFYILNNHILNGNFVNIGVSKNYEFMYVNNIIDPWNLNVDNPNLFAQPGKMQKLSGGIIDVKLGF